MFRTLLPVALLGLSGTAFAQEVDLTTAGIADLEAQAVSEPGVRERGSSRSSARSTSSRSRSSGAARSQGSRTVSKSVQSNGQVTRTRTTGTATHKVGRSGDNRAGGTTSATRGGERTRTQTTYTNGDRTITRETGTVRHGADFRQSNDRGDVRGVSARDERVRVSTTSTRAGVRDSRSLAIPERSPGRVGSAPPRAGSGPHAAPARVGHAPPRAGSGPHAVRSHGHAPVRVAHGHHHHTRVVTYHHVRPYHGVFVYGPRPTSHVHYVDHGGPVQVKQRHLPDRQIDRENSLAIGLRGGSLYSGYIGANGYADIGLGLAARYRPDEAVGLEVAFQHHDQTWDSASERSQTMVAGSVELFAWPWTRVSPYVLGGLTYTARDIQDEIWQFDSLATVDTGKPLVGPHVGLGLELALGDSVALDLEARYIGYLNRDLDDASYPGALTTTAGVMVHF